MLGYLAQVEYALLRAVDCLLAGEVNMSVSIEIEDDFSLDPGDLSRPEWWQTKHSVDASRTISDSDPEFWKALGAWLRHRRAEHPTKFYFLTTAQPAKGSAYECLGSRDRGEETAVARLEAALEKSKSETLAKHAQAWSVLPHTEKIDFLAAVEVVHSAPQADEFEQHLATRLRPFFGPKFVGAGAQAIRGWWVRRVQGHLISFWKGDSAPIDLLELEEAIGTTRDRLRDDDLPVRYDVTAVPPSGDEPVFVKQLRMIALHDQRIAIAIQDHNRAFFNRSYWQRESLLRVGELGAYDERLKTAWRRHFLPDAGGAPVDDDGASAVNAARSRYIRLESSDLPRIRGSVREEFIATGSLHILADRLEVGWHPDWIEQLQALLSADEDPESGEGAA